MDKLQTLVLETANASIAISVNEDGWFTTLGNTKKKFQNPTLPGLCDDLTSFITTNRKVKESTPKSPKTFTL